MEINKSLRLPNNQFFNQPHAKSGIVLHHTVGGTARSTFEHWKSAPDHIGTAYIIERDGTVFEVFAPEAWAYHLGLKGTGGSHDRRTIGIEIASEGALRESEGKLYCFDRISPRTLHTSAHFDNGEKWRGFRYFDAYEEAQMVSIVDLVNHLCMRFQIPRRVPAKLTEYDPNYLAFKGVFGHHHVRNDKSDIHPGFDWERLIQACSLELS
jgi:N-acetyl-anhydromuramyl-L-alanine amidase AmpD